MYESNVLHNATFLNVFINNFLDRYSIKLIWFSISILTTVL